MCVGSYSVAAWSYVVDLHTLHSVSFEKSLLLTATVEIIRVRFRRLRCHGPTTIHANRRVASSPNAATQTILKRRKDVDVVMPTPYLFNTVR